MARVPAFQAGYAGSIPVTRSMKDFCCKQCGTTDSSLRYPSGRMTRCMDCQRYYNISVNARKVRVHQAHTPAVVVSLDDFLEWCRATTRKCAFCGLHETDLPSIGIVSSIGRPVVALGIDRIRNDDDYRIGNIQFACYACNKVKGNVFQDEEMKDVVGPAIGKAWTNRKATIPKD